MDGFEDDDGDEVGDVDGDWDCDGDGNDNWDENWNSDQDRNVCGDDDGYGDSDRNKDRVGMKLGTRRAMKCAKLNCRGPGEDTYLPEDT